MDDARLTVEHDARTHQTAGKIEAHGHYVSTSCQHAPPNTLPVFICFDENCIVIEYSEVIREEIERAEIILQ